MAAFHQFAHSLLRRKEKLSKPNASNEEEEIEGCKDVFLQRPQSPSELTSTDNKKQNRISRFDGHRRFRSQKGRDEEKSKKRRSRSLISFFTDAISSASPLSPRHPSKQRPPDEMEAGIYHPYKKMSSVSCQAQNSAVSTPASPAKIVKTHSQRLPFFTPKSSANSTTPNVQALVAQFSGKASAMVQPMTAEGYYDQSSTIPKSPQEDISFADGKNLLNKKEGVGIIKESTESSQTIEEQDGDVKSSGGNNLKHENTVVHVDTAAMAAAAVATAGVGIGASSVTSPSPLTTPTTPGLPPSAKKQEIVKLTESLIEAITSSDYATYSKLCDANVTCFEPESLGNLIEGLEFHKFYFDNPPKAGTSNSLKNVRSSLLNPHVHLLGDDSACIAYVRLTQWVNRNGIALSQRCEETRIWQKRDGKWHCVHFHRSSTSSSVYAPSCEDAGISGMIRNTPC